VEIFTLIKPNEDFLAWHDGNGKKLSGDFIWNWHLNREGSYSVSYLVQSLAFTKWIQGCFDRTLVAGLSQGGQAAFINGIQSQPTTVISSSGLSQTYNIVEHAGPQQIIVPGLFPLIFDHEFLTNTISQSNTHFIFTWGLQEKGIFKLEAYEKHLQSLDRLSNVHTIYHQHGHIFPVDKITRALFGIDNN